MVNFFDNGLTGNNGFNINSVQSRNDFTRSNASSFMRDPIQGMTSVISKSFEVYNISINKTNDILTSVEKKLSNTLDALVKNTQVKPVSMNQIAKENEIRSNSVISSIKSSLEKSQEVQKSMLKKLTDLKFSNVANGLSNEAILVLSILLLNKLGLGNIVDSLKGLKNSSNLIKDFAQSGLSSLRSLGSRGLNLLSGLKTSGLQFLSELKLGALSKFEDLKVKSLPIFESFKNKGLTYLETLKSSGSSILSSLRNRGLSYIQSMSNTTKSRIIDFSVRGISAFDRMRTSTSSIFSRMSSFVTNTFSKVGNTITSVMARLSNLSSNVFNGLKTGFTSLYGFMGKLGSSIGEVLSKIPGMGALKTIGTGLLKSVGGIFSGYDFAEGVADAERITGMKRQQGLAGKAQGFVGGALNMGTGFINSFADLGTMATGYNFGNLDPKGVYMAVTGTDSEYMGKNIRGMTGLDRVGATYDYFMGNTLSGQPVNQDVSKRRNGRPVDNMNISSYPAPLRGNRPHKGTDITVPSGTPVYATGGGKAFIGNDPTGWGTYIQIEHGNGYVTRYAHLSKINIKNGQMVREGQLIGLSGGGKGEIGSGNSRGSHLHYELWKDGKWLNPFGGKNRDSNFSDMISVTESSANMSAISQDSSLKNLAFEGIAKNEGSVSNPTALTKDNVGYTFGLSQFNSSTNPESWKKLGFNQAQINEINKGNFDKNILQNYLNTKRDQINKMDMQNRDDLFNWASDFGKKYSIDISDPVVFANIMDIGNQFNKSSINQETANKLIKYSGGRKITPKAIMMWRNQTLQGKKSSQDQKRRFETISKTFEKATEYSSGYTASASSMEMDNVEKITQIVDLKPKVQEVIDKVSSISNTQLAQTMINQPDMKNITDVVKTQPFKDARNIYNNRNTFFDIAERVNKLSSNFNLQNALNLGSGIYNNRSTISNVASSVGSLAGNLTEDKKPLSIPMPYEVIKLGGTIVEGKSALDDITNSVMNSVNNPTDIVGNFFRVGSSLMQGKDKISNIAGSVGGIFLPINTTQKEAVQANLDFVNKEKQMTNQQPVIIQQQSAPSQENNQVVMNKSMQINDMYLMTLVSGVFD